MEAAKADKEYYRQMHAFEERAIIVGQQLIDLERERDSAHKQLYECGGGACVSGCEVVVL